MTDEVIAPVGTTPAGRTWATILGYILCMYSLGLITYVTLYGSDKNTLHTSAQSWAFTTCLGVAASLGLSQAASTFLKK